MAQVGLATIKDIERGLPEGSNGRVICHSQRIDETICLGCLQLWQAKILLELLMSGGFQMFEITICPSSLKEGHNTYSRKALGKLFGGEKVNPILSFDIDDSQNAKELSEAMHRISVSGKRHKLLRTYHEVTN